MIEFRAFIMAKTPEEIVATREHAILTSRRQQVSYNLKALRGGNPYIDARLFRAPNESDLSWTGNQYGVTGRRQRAFLLNDAGRVAQKLNQYLFASEPTRTGIDAAWAKDVTTTGLTVNAFWQQVNELFTAGGWLWLSADRGAPEIDPATSRPRARSMAQREAMGDRVFWNIWEPTEVVDWHFDAFGRLTHLITDESRYENEDPMTEPTTESLRTLWRRNPAGATWQRYTTDGDGKVKVGAGGFISVPDIPFMPVGIPAITPWWFDDVEMIQQALLNFDSLHSENLVKTVYPQLVVPASMVNDLQGKLVERLGQNSGGRVVEVVREIIRGLDRPFVESAEDKGLTRYLQPSAADMNAIPEYKNSLRQKLFDMVGLALFNRETRQVQSAESKQFDHLDTAATLRNRALIMQDAEIKLVDLSVSLDNTFRVYAPEWPQEFDVSTTAEDSTALAQIGNMAELTPGMRKALQRAVVSVLDGIIRIKPEDRKEIDAEIEAGEGAGLNSGPLV